MRAEYDFKRVKRIVELVNSNFIQSEEDLKSMFCLVLGLCGDVSFIPFLMEEARRMEKEYPDEYYDQGPELAVQELAVRYLN